ncbi:AraC family transcriptional regulator [Roseivivax halodurans JCM 10272]|uniref:AraC family transcriptional regulator n=1 Tax=Roseivivax halodurans JCM 10272 TaxID=1449350 RepID=X7EBY4_9RHOB|nr:AraC family transcriptional regulator [Roseivivax halodurans]ETX12726.1 AraC family transcriptional regulator [Roseivivax halodurans JCM 10272]
MTHDVREVLERSPVARATRTLDIGGGRTVAIWENGNDRVLYEAPRSHTFSYYIEGGGGNRRLDATSEPGGPGTICIMPEGQTSAWQIGKPCRFVHLYMPDDRLRLAFAEVHDRDARTLDLQEATFADLPRMAAPLKCLARAADTGDAMLADTAVAELVSQLGAGSPVLRGGLAPRTLNRIDEYIDTNIERSIKLAELAGLSGLSPFHLCRMFKASRGMSPHAWITTRRIARAKAMLRGRAALLDTALACGFSSQSHFSRSFRAETGNTPTAYRRAFGAPSK